MKKRPFSEKRRLVPVVGLEPTRGFPQQILSLPRLPFRHTGIYLIYYIIFDSVCQALFLVTEDMRVLWS